MIDLIYCENPINRLLRGVCMFAVYSNLRSIVYDFYKTKKKVVNATSVKSKKSQSSCVSQLITKVMLPIKRSRPPQITTQALLDFDLGESSSDSDFRIEDHAITKDDGECGSSAESSTSCGSDSDVVSGGTESGSSAKQIFNDDIMTDEPFGNGGKIDMQLKLFSGKVDQIYSSGLTRMCCVCLGERSDDSNEIIECDGCGVFVHEGCYGVSDNMSISSTNSTCSTEPWFCEACRAGVSEPMCQLCPNKGGIYKETDVGMWVHLICALYVPGVAFGEVEQLSSVTLFEMQYSKWGAKVCSLCENPLFARCGVCIGCDAGMCKTYFHVTCAQSAGFLIEAHHEDADAADPFYAHCKIHSEKEMIRKRKRNYQTLRMNMKIKSAERLTLKLDDPSPAQLRIHRKLVKIQGKYSMQKQLKPEPWVPTQKMSRLLTTSASACKRLLTKAVIMSVDVELMERQDAQIAVLRDIRKKWHIAPAFSVEFVAYYLDKLSRIGNIRMQLNEMYSTNMRLTKQQDKLRLEYDEALEQLKIQKLARESVLSSIILIHKTILMLNPNKILPNPENVGVLQPQSPIASTPPQRPISVPTAAALKMGVGFPLSHLCPPGTKVDATRMLSIHSKNSPLSNSGLSPAMSSTSILQNCGICKMCSDQHLFAKCDTCNLHYHLGCLNPPLTRHPKKSKQYGWQCSECCEKSDSCDTGVKVSSGRRKSRTRYSHDGFIVSVKRRHSGRESLLENQNSFEPIPKKEKSSFMNPQSKVEGFFSGISFDDRRSQKRAKSSVERLHSPVKTIPKKYQLELSTAEANMQSNVVSAIVDITNDISDPLALPLPNIANTSISFNDSFDSNLKFTRKQKRKEKHKSKHNSSSDIDKSSIKEHKRKRKRKHEENSLEASSANVPKIKIKFKTLPLPGEDTPEAQFFYVPADAVRSAEEASRPTSVETVEDGMHVEPIPQAQNHFTIKNNVSSLIPLLPKSKRKVSLRKPSLYKSKLGRPRSTSAKEALETRCYVCSKPGKINQVVTCDECCKHYHFGCLEPPVKKSPKIRGYSWHCADCDPTDAELK